MAIRKSGGANPRLPTEQFLAVKGKIGYLKAIKFAPATSDAIWLGKVRQARRMSAEERVLAGPRLFAGVCERMKEGIRDERPDAGEDEIHRLLLRRFEILGKLESGRHPIP